MNPEFKFSVIFQNVAMIESLQSGDFVFDVAFAVRIFYSHWSFFPSRRGCLEDFSVRSSTEKTVAFLTETDSQTSSVNQLSKLAAIAAASSNNT